MAEPLTFREWCFRHSTRFYGPSPGFAPLSWIGNERIAVGKLPTAVTLPLLPAHGVTHVVNCRSTPQTWISQDLAVERILLGPSRVVHAPMWDSGRPQPPRLWSTAAHFAARVLADDEAARVFVHCRQGRRRSVMLTYAVLRLRGYGPDEATDLIAQHRAEAVFVEVYTADVERWLASGADPVGRLRIR